MLYSMVRTTSFTALAPSPTANFVPTRDQLNLYPVAKKCDNRWPSTWCHLAVIYAYALTMIFSSPHPQQTSWWYINNKNTVKVDALHDMAMVIMLAIAFFNTADRIGSWISLPCLGVDIWLDGLIRWKLCQKVFGNWWRKKVLKEKIWKKLEGKSSTYHWSSPLDSGREYCSLCQTRCYRLIRSRRKRRKELKCVTYVGDVSNKEHMKRSSQEGKRRLQGKWMWLVATLGFGSLKKWAMKRLLQCEYQRVYGTLSSLIPYMLEQSVHRYHVICHRDSARSSLHMTKTALVGLSAVEYMGVIAWTVHNLDMPYQWLKRWPSNQRTTQKMPSKTSQ